jgi:HlyD family secretion protein
VATILTKDKIADISLNEIDIVNVKLGQSVDLTFDAIPNETFKGIVAQIDTVGVQTSNVVSFDVKISIPNADERIKSGMSVSANIIINEKDGILTVPSATIKSEGKGDEIKYYVLRKKSTGGAPAVATDTTGTSTRKFNRSGGIGTNEKVYVTVGITNNIDTEITGGINEGEQVVSKTVTAAKTTTTTSFSLFGGGPRVGGGGGNGGANRTGGGATAR